MSDSEPDSPAATPTPPALPARPLEVGRAMSPLERIRLETASQIVAAYSAKQRLSTEEMLDLVKRIADALE